jgi:glucose-6-phosphate dehydrogenase assembly protein OpcA
MIALWDTTGTAVVKALAAERRNAGGVASGLALTLVTVVDDESRVREAETAAATAAAAHPCRLIIVVRGESPPPDSGPSESHMDAEIVVGGRLGPCEGVVLRMRGRLVHHAESVVIPLLAPDVPVVTWWHGIAPTRIAYDALGVVADRRITDAGQSPDPIAVLRQRAEDYAPGDTDLTWTRATPWRSCVASALDTADSPVVAATVRSAPEDPTGALLRGWLRTRLGIEPETRPDGPLVQGVSLRLASGEELVLERADGSAILRRSGLPDRALPLPRRQLGDQLAEELRRLGPDQAYSAALEAISGQTGLSGRPPARVHVWHDPSGAPAANATAGPALGLFE